MGFGLICVGYFFASVMSSFSYFAFTKLIGYPMILLGLYKLRPYHDRFRYCYFFGFLSLPFAFFYTDTSVGALSELFGRQAQTIFTPLVASVFEWCYFGFSVLFLTGILFAIGGFATELSHERIKIASYRNMIFLLMYAALYLVSYLPFVANGEGVKYLAFPLILLQSITRLLVLWLAFSCYRDFCPAECEEMELEELPLELPKK